MKQRANRLRRAAGKQAKEAAEGTYTHLQYITSFQGKGAFPGSIAAIKVHYKISAAMGTSQWPGSKCTQRQSRYDPAPPTRRILKFYSDLPQQSCSVITQHWTGVIGLNDYLFKIGAVDSPKCAFCHVKENVEHFLLQCRRFISELNKLQLTLGKDQLLIYVHATKRFSNYCDYFDTETKNFRPRALG